MPWILTTLIGKYERELKFLYLLAVDIADFDLNAKTKIT